jgi:hypothetical protein
LPYCKIAMEISYSWCHKQLKYGVFIIVVIIQFKRKFPQTFEYDKMMFKIFVFLLCLEGDFIFN